MFGDFFKNKNCKYFIFALVVLIIVILYLIIENFVLPKYNTNKSDDLTCTINESEENQVEVINIYADWCGWSKKLLPEWSKVEDYYKNDNNISIRKVEEKEDPELIQKLQIAGFPSIFKVRNGEISEFPHSEKRTANNIIKWINN